MNGKEELIIQKKKGLDLINSAISVFSMTECSDVAAKYRKHYLEALTHAENFGIK